MPNQPTPDEYGPPLAGYISKIAPGENILDVLTAQLHDVPALFAGVTEPHAAFRYAPDKWTVKDIVGHLSDVERVFSYRALRFARNDATPLPGFDQDVYAPELGAGRRSLADLVAEWSDIRRATLALFRHLPDNGWDRRGTASGNPASVRALAHAIAGHVRHHVDVLEARYLSHFR